MDIGNKYLHEIIMVATLEPISLIPLAKFGDFESFGEMRFIIESKGNKVYFNSKVTTPILYKTHGFQMFK